MAAQMSTMSTQSDGVTLDYSRQQATSGTMQLLLDLAKRQKLTEKIAAMQRGEKINFTEKRAVLHHATRATKNTKIVVDGVDTVAQVSQWAGRVGRVGRGREVRLLAQTHRRPQNVKISK